MGNPIIQVSNVGKCYQIGTDQQCRYRTLRESITDVFLYPLRQLKTGAAIGSTRDFWAVKDVSFDVEPGQILGIVGRNGAGKSTLLKMLSGITTPSVGRIELRGRVGSLLEVGTGFHPELTGRENIFLNGSILGMQKQEIAAKFDAIVDYSGVEEFLDTPVKRYSSGMKVRLAFAVAAFLEPEILIIDEVLAVGDVSFQRKCLGRMGEVARSGKTVLFVSHNLTAVRALCSHAMLLDDGQVTAQGPVDEVLSRYLASTTNGGQEHVWKPGKRQNGNVEIDSVRLCDSDGCTVSSVAADGNVHVEVCFHLSEADSNLSIGFDLVNSNGQTLFRSHHNDREQSEWPHVHVGDNCLRAGIPSDLLATGEYSISLRVGVHFGPWLFNEESILRFEITEPNPINDFWRVRNSRRELINPLLTWARCG